MKRSRPKFKTPSRKKEHVNLTVKRDVSFREKRTGFDQWEFVHNALPEIDFADISTETAFLSKRLAFPFMISCMTGGYADAKRINKNLAEVCEEQCIAMGVGSQRQALEDTTYHSSFSVVREVAPTIPIVGNIGAAEVAKLVDVSPVQRLADLIRADAFAVHLNPLQEFLQPEGNVNFRGVLGGIEKLVRGLSIPVIVKEIGAGISKNVAERLINAGVTIIDVAGAGGTSWAGVEILRRKEGINGQRQWQQFWDWGIPTAEALKQVSTLKPSSPALTLIASGGIASGLEAAKAIALGADLTASARPMLQVLTASGKKGLSIHLEQWMKEFKGAMFLVGASTIRELQRAQINRV
jgi:isopentenyl-diphosphate delta-isomerase